MEAGREMDALVAEKVMGTPFMKPRHGNCCTCQDCGWPHDECKCGFSTEIERAWEVVEKMRVSGWNASIEVMDDGLNIVTFWKGQNWDEATDTATAHDDKSLTLAICLAALKTVGVDV